DAAKTAGVAEKPADPENVWPDDEWYREPKFSALAEWLQDWALTNTPAVPIAFDPRNAAELAKAYKAALYDARFTMRLYNARYPFVESPRPTLRPDEPRVQTRDEFYHFLQCHTCHVLGNEAADGVNKLPKGPNLLLVQRRLQDEWVRRWLQETQ